MFTHLGLGIQPAKKTWGHDTYSLFRNDKEQLLWQFSFVILAPTRRWLASFVLNCRLEVTSTGGWRWRIWCTPTLASMCEFNFFFFFLRCMCFCKSEWGEKVRVFFFPLFWNKVLCSRDLTRATVDRCHQISSWEGEGYHCHRLQCGDTWGPIHRATEQPWSCCSSAP